jgi:xanthine dehydrogenase YagS FAD-binding subunit
MAYGASVRLVSERGERMVKLEDFFVSPADDPTRETVVEPDEILVEIVAPPNTATTSAYRKVRARRSWDFNLAGGAFVLALSGTKVDSASVVLAGVAPVPWRSRTIEEAIIGKTLDEKTITAAAQAAVADAKPMRQNGYKVDLLRGVVVEELTRAAG